VPGRHRHCDRQQRGLADHSRRHLLRAAGALVLRKRVALVQEPAREAHAGRRKLSKALADNALRLA
jgi:hypothetical protein